MKVSTLSADIEQRPAARAMNVKARIHTMIIFGEFFHSFISYASTQVWRPVLAKSVPAFLSMRWQKN